MKRVALASFASSVAWLGDAAPLFALLVCVGVCREARAEPTAPEPTIAGSPPPRSEAARTEGFGGISLDASAGVANFGGWANGVHGVVVFSARGARVGAALGYTDESSPLNELNARLWRAGAVVAIGAPWDSHVVGCALEIGAAIGETKGTPDPHGVSFLTPAPIGSPYAQWSIVIQVPLEPAHPWVGVNASFVLDQLGQAVQTLSLTGGVAWTAW